MSSKPTTVKETLHTCPKCGQPGFTAKGLKAHQGNKTCKERAKEGQLVKAGQGKIVLMKEFDQARRYVSEIRELGRKAQHMLVLLGFELNKQKAALGERRGGDRKSADQKPHVAVFDRWEDIVEQQTGLSVDTCDRWMKIAKGASKSLPILMAKDVIEKPFSALPEARQQEVEKILHKAVDGQTMHSLMLTFGVWKDKAHKSPPKATKQSAANRNANADNQTLTAEQRMKVAKEDTNTLHDMHTGEAWMSLDDSDLADLENKIKAFGLAVAAELKLRKGAKA